MDGLGSIVLKIKSPSLNFGALADLLPALLSSSFLHLILGVLTLSLDWLVLLFVILGDVGGSVVSRQIRSLHVLVT